MQGKLYTLDDAFVFLTFGVCLCVCVTAPPVISGTMRLQEVLVVLGQEVKFQCRVSGRPAPRVEWSRDGE